jgi:O-methyltransferase involved in polyketide biosynthesis
MDIDITKPHIGRIYDYVLGGSNNHEADRRAAEAMIQIMPAYPRFARDNRAFLSHVGRRWAAEGHRRVLDLGSGLPTQGHFNVCLPEAKILFSDIEPLTIVLARQLLAHSPDMAYVEVDLTRPEPLFAQAEEFFGDERVLAVGCIGIAYFLSDQQVRHLMERLHAFCAPGSTLALSYFGPPRGEEAAKEELGEAGHEFARAAGVELFARTPEHLAEIIAPWRVTANNAITDWVPEREPHVRTNHPMERFEFFGALADHE